VPHSENSVSHDILLWLAWGVRPWVIDEPHPRIYCVSSVLLFLLGALSWLGGVK